MKGDPKSQKFALYRFKPFGIIVHRYAINALWDAVLRSFQNFTAVCRSRFMLRVFKKLIHAAGEELLVSVI